MQQVGGTTRLVADLEQARWLLGYTPNVLLREGLLRLLAEDLRFSAARAAAVGGTAARIRWRRSDLTSAAPTAGAHRLPGEG